MIGKGITEVDPRTAWEALASDKKTLLIDVRTDMEWTSIGVPDTSSLPGQEVAFVEWQSMPQMQVDPDFVRKACDAIAGSGAEEAYFICRSGVRSFHAAQLTSGSTDCACINVAGGFEGDPNAQGQRGVVNGWQADGLPWRQG